MEWTFGILGVVAVAILIYVWKRPRKPNKFWFESDEDYKRRITGHGPKDGSV
jgi:hypothetical protein